jgi:hypothetical protein
MVSAGQPIERGPKFQVAVQGFHTLTPHLHGPRQVRRAMWLPQHGSRKSEASGQSPLIVFLLLPRALAGNALFRFSLRAWQASALPLFAVYIAVPATSESIRPRPTSAGQLAAIKKSAAHAGGSREGPQHRYCEATESQTRSHHSQSQNCAPEGKGFCR